MSSLQNHKRRIKSISNTLDVANAMELVSSVKLKKLKTVYDKCKEYYLLKEKTIKEALAKVNQLEIKDSGEDWIVIITSSLGLCGSYNEEVIKLLEEISFLDKKIIILGEKGISYFKNKGIDVYKSYSDYNELTSIEVADLLIENRNKGLVRSIEVIYTSYKNNFIQIVKKEKIYPYINENSEENGEYIIETDLNSLINIYLVDTIDRMLLESILSENASRNMAMHQASENATDLKNELILVYNKLRQQQITNEIRDIVSGGD